MWLYLKSCYVLILIYMGLKLPSLCIGYITTGFVKFSPSLSNYQLSLIGSGPGFELLTSEVEGEAVAHNTTDPPVTK